MLRIGICDDDEMFLWELEGYLLKYSDVNNISVTIELFCDAQSLFSDLEKQGPYDILFLDIKLKQNTGIEVGKKIRSELKNEVMQIVFISSREQYAMQLFDIRPMNFLIKPIEDRKVAYIMDEYNRLFGFQNRFFIYHRNRQEYKVNEQCIIYFQSQGKKIQIITQDGKEEFYGKLSDVLKTLNQHIFCQVHKSFLINIRHVLKFGAKDIEMVNHEKIPVSQSMKKEVNQWILKNK